MPSCKACQRRRRLLVAGYAKGGVVGVVKAVPAIVRDVLRGETEAAKPKSSGDGAKR